MAKRATRKPDKSQQRQNEVDLDLQIDSPPWPSAGENAQEIRAAANDLAEQFDADVLFFAGMLERGAELQVRDLILNEHYRTNVLLLMCTCGGDADAAYLIAKCLQSNYDKFIFFVSGFCKSAGTLVAMGANELVFSQYGELGPLDIQLRKKDELTIQESGSAVRSALTHLVKNSYSAWETFFEKIYVESQGAITFPTAASVAADLTTGLFAPISQQINPVYLGEVHRACAIARQYGEILDRRSKNLKPEGLTRVMEHYASHTFVIDKDEADQIFHRVRYATAEEERLRVALGPGLTFAANSKESPVIQFLDGDGPC